MKRLQLIAATLLVALMSALVLAATIAEAAPSIKEP